MRELDEGFARFEKIIESKPPGAYIASVETIKMAIQNNPLAYYVALEQSSQLFNDYIALAVQKNWPFRGILDKLLS